MTSFFFIFWWILAKNEENFSWKFTDGSSVKYFRIHKWTRWIRPKSRLIILYFHTQNGKTIEITTYTPSPTEESTISTTTIQPNSQPELCKINFLPARVPLGHFNTPFKICTRKMLKKVPFQKCGRGEKKDNDCVAGVRLLFLRIVSISKIWNRFTLTISSQSF